MKRPEMQALSADDVVSPGRLSENGYGGTENLA